MARQPKRAAQARPQSAQDQRIARYKVRHPDWRSDPDWHAKARGHAPKAGVKEHVVRRQRERATGLVDYEKRVVRDLARKQARRMATSRLDVDQDEIVRRFEIWARANGFEKVKAFKAAIRAREKIKRHRVRVRRKVGGRVIRVEITGASSQVSAMQSDVGEFGLPDLPDDLPEWFWFFYH